MEEDRTLPATPRRRQKHRQKGNVPRSVEINTVFMLLGVLFLLLAIGGKLAVGIGTLSKYYFSESGSIQIRPENMSSIISFTISKLTPFFIPFFLVVIGIGIVSTFALGGFIFAPASLAPKWGVLNPIQGVRRLFGQVGLFNLVKSVVKILLIGVIAYLGIKAIAPSIASLSLASAEVQANFLSKSAFNLTLRITLVFLLVAIMDYYFQRWHYEKSIRMTPSEVKEELRQYEGPPEVRSRVRAKQREIARRRMMREVPKAAVVITNPTELAVALKYEPKENRAPLVVAKGGGVVAKKIKEVANRYGVPIVENKELARLLFRFCKIGDEIPVRLYHAVAEVIAYVYRLREKVGQGFSRARL